MECKVDCKVVQSFKVDTEVQLKSVNQAKPSHISMKCKMKFISSSSPLL